MTDWTSQLIGFSFLWLVVWGVPFVCVLWFGYLALRLPLRRQERARLFLDLVESGLRDGKSVKDTVSAVSLTGDASVGKNFLVLATLLESGSRLRDALDAVPRLLPPQVNGMLKAGERIGDLQKVMPACRRMLGDALSQTQSALNYVLVMTTYFVVPVAMIVLTVFEIYVLPQFLLVMQGLAEGTPLQQPAFLTFVDQHKLALFGVQAVLMAFVWAAAALYLGGPQLTAWFDGWLSPLVSRVQYAVPWRRRRMQRDFSAMLAVLLDAGVPESEALELAADCTANGIFRRRAAEAANHLKQGMKLTEAVGIVDDAGEFRWRLANACHANGGFFEALAGWNQALDAKAFQQEQAAAQVITTAIVLVNGLVVGAVVVAIFHALTNLIALAETW
jgi:type II secretory pathway component PulF